MKYLEKVVLKQKKKSNMLYTNNKNDFSKFLINPYSTNHPYHKWKKSQII